MILKLLEHYGRAQACTVIALLTDIVHVRPLYYRQSLAGIHEPRKVLNPADVRRQCTVRKNATLYLHKTARLNDLRSREMDTFQFPRPVLLI